MTWTDSGFMLSGCAVPGRSPTPTIICTYISTVFFSLSRSQLSPLRRGVHLSRLAQISKVMASCWRAFSNALNRSLPQRRLFSNRHAVKLPRDVPVEEETLPHYEAEQYFPVHIGDTFNARYRVIGKLGFGAYSTSWLCHDV